MFYTYFDFYQTMYVNITSSHCLQEERDRLEKVCSTATVSYMYVCKTKDA